MSALPTEEIAITFPHLFVTDLTNIRSLLSDLDFVGVYPLLCEVDTIKEAGHPGLFQGLILPLLLLVSPIPEVFQLFELLVLVRELKKLLVLPIVLPQERVVKGKVGNGLNIPILIQIFHANSVYLDLLGLVVGWQVVQNVIQPGKSRQGVV